MNIYTIHTQNQQPIKRRYARHLTHLFIVLLSFCFAAASLAQTQTPEEQQVEPRELHELSNEELLEQAQQTLATASTSFLAQLRAMLRSDALVQEVRQKAESVYIPPAEIRFPAQEMTALEQAQLTLEHLEKRLEALNVLTPTDEHGVPVRAADGASPLGGGVGLTGYERQQLRRFHAIILGDLLFPGVVRFRQKANFVDKRLTKPRPYRDVYRYDRRLISAMNNKVKSYKSLFFGEEPPLEERNYLQKVANSLKKQ